MYSADLIYKCFVYIYIGCCRFLIHKLHLEQTQIKVNKQNINKLKCAPKKIYILSISNKTKFCSKCIQGFEI